MVYVFLADGFEEIEALTPIDVLRRVGIDVCSVGITGKTVTGSHKISVEADILSDDFNEKDVEAIILPGGLPGTLNLDNSAFVREQVQKAYENSRLVCAICAAPMIFGKMGILKNKKATCYPGIEKHFIDATYEKESVVKHENVITSNGMGSALKFAFEIVKTLKGEKIAEKVKEEILY